MLCVVWGNFGVICTSCGIPDFRSKAASTISSPIKPCLPLLHRRRPLLLTRHYLHHKPPFPANNLCQRQDCETRTCLTQVFGRTPLQLPCSTNSLPRCARRSKKKRSIRAGVTDLSEHSETMEG